MVCWFCTLAVVCLPNNDREMHTRTKWWLQNSQSGGHKVGKSSHWNCVRPLLSLQLSGLTSITQVHKSCQGADRYRRTIRSSRGVKANPHVDFNLVAGV